VPRRSRYLRTRHFYLAGTRHFHLGPTVTHPRKRFDVNSCLGDRARSAYDPDTLMLSRTAARTAQVAVYGAAVLMAAGAGCTISGRTCYKEKLVAAIVEGTILFSSPLVSASGSIAVDFLKDCPQASASILSCTQDAGTHPRDVSFVLDVETSPLAILILGWNVQPDSVVGVSRNALVWDSLPAVGTHSLRDLGVCLETCPTDRPEEGPGGCWPLGSNCLTTSCDASGGVPVICIPIDATFVVATNSRSACRSDNTGLAGQTPNMVCNTDFEGTLTIQSTKGSASDLAGTTLRIRYRRQVVGYDCSSFNN
jgi:hypothetical protein